MKWLHQNLLSCTDCENQRLKPYLFLECDGQSGHRSFAVQSNDEVVDHAVI